MRLEVRALFLAGGAGDADYQTSVSPLPNDASGCRAILFIYVRLKTKRISNNTTSIGNVNTDAEDSDYVDMLGSYHALHVPVD